MRHLFAMVAIFAALGFCGIIIDASKPPPATAAPTVCHGHNSACLNEASTAPAATLTVNADSTTLTATGFAPNTDLTVQVTYWGTDGTELEDVSGYDKTDANGAATIAYGLGSSAFPSFGLATAHLSDGTTSLDVTT